MTNRQDKNNMYAPEVCVCVCGGGGGGRGGRSDINNE